jgi:cysteine desulfurase
MIYLDNAATTPVSDEVLNAMMPYFKDCFGNPSSLHAFGRKAAAAVDAARDKIASILGAKASEIYFTSCGTESNNWAIKGAVDASKKTTKHIVTTQIEHHAVLDVCCALEKEGVLVTYVSVNKDGIVNVDEIKKAVTQNTVLVTVMTANNEIGTIQPISEIGQFCKDAGILFHTDAVQAAGSLSLNVNELNVDMLSLSAHKFYAPKGVGALYIRESKKDDVKKLLHGGAQERNQRAGTTNTPLIVGMAKGLEIAQSNRETESKRLIELRNYFINRVFEEIPHVRLNGCIKNRLPNNINLIFEFINSGGLLERLDLIGKIAVSSGSACAASALEPSHVIRALGVSEELLQSSIRFSLGNKTTKEEIDYTLKTLKEAVEFLRAISLFKQEKGEGIYV